MCGATNSFKWCYVILYKKIDTTNPFNKMIVFELLNMKRLVQNRLVIDTVRLKLDRL